MKALSIRQPWAWLIVHAGKDVENRSWSTSVRGRVLIHASKGCTRVEYDEASGIAQSVVPSIYVPPLAELERGGIVGSVEIADCVRESRSLWFLGEFGFVLRDPRVLPFTPYPGRLGFFDIPFEGEQCQSAPR